MTYYDIKTPREIEKYSTQIQELPEINKISFQVLIN